MMKATPVVRQVGKGNSLFAFINDYCLEEQTGVSENMAFHRLCTLMRKMNVQTAIIEDLNPQGSLIDDERLALSTYYQQNVEIKAYRITFLLKKVLTLDEVEQLDNDRFLSSNIIINFKDIKGIWHSYIFASIMIIPRIAQPDSGRTFPLLNNYVHIYKTFTCEIERPGGKKISFKIIGTFFCQQNQITHVCAHSVLRMTINNMSLGINLISPEDINRSLGIDHVKTKTGGDAGLSEEQIVTVLKKYGLKITGVDFFQYPNVEYDDYMYNYVESKCPTLLGFATGSPTRHVVSVIGHTLNSDMWKPEAEIGYSKPGSRLGHKSASAWVDHFVIHDDNFGMYQCLPVDSLKKITLPMWDPNFRATIAVAVIPSNVTIEPWEVKYASDVVVKDTIERLLKQGVKIDDWTGKIISSRRPIVIRTLLVSKSDYAKSLEFDDFEGTKFSPTDKDNLVENLPDLFWLSEITLPDLYSANKSKIIDFFYGCSDPPIGQDYDKVFERWIQIRFPGALTKRAPTPPNISHPMSVKSHYPLLRFGGIQPSFDW